MPKSISRKQKSRKQKIWKMRGCASKKNRSRTQKKGGVMKGGGLFDSLMYNINSFAGYDAVNPLPYVQPKLSTFKY